MIQPAITISLTPEAKNGPFVLRGGLASACAIASDLGFKAVEVFPPSAEQLNKRELRKALKQHNLKLAAVGTGAGWLVRKLTLISPDPRVRKQAEQFIAGIVRIAGSFGAPA